MKPAFLVLAAAFSIQAHCNEMSNIAIASEGRRMGTFELSGQPCSFESWKMDISEGVEKRFIAFQSQGYQHHADVSLENWKVKRDFGFVLYESIDESSPEKNIDAIFHFNEELQIDSYQLAGDSRGKCILSL